MSRQVTPKDLLVQEARAEARGLDDRTLAARLGALELKRSAYPRAEADAYIYEAASRLRNRP